MIASKGEGRRFTQAHVDMLSARHGPSGVVECEGDALRRAGLLRGSTESVETPAEAKERQAD